MSMLDVVIVGGSYAGLAAALQLGRARRRVLVLDAGERRNRFATHAHGFLGFDGQPPGAIVERARADLRTYPTVTLRTAQVTEVRGAQDDFRVIAGGEVHHARRVVLATGVVDELPEVAGLRERWGRTVFHCPYCHGYELGLGRVGVLATTETSLHQAVLASEWAGPGQMYVFLHRGFEPAAEPLAELAQRGIHVERRALTHVTGERTLELHLAGGDVVTLDALFVQSRTAVGAPFAAQLGLALDQSPVGTFIKTDALKETSVPGAFACGDAGLAMGSVSFAVADGARAGISAHQSLVFRPRA